MKIYKISKLVFFFLFSIPLVDLRLLSCKRGDYSLFKKNKGGICTITIIEEVNVISINLKQCQCSFPTIHFR